MLKQIDCPLCRRRLSGVAQGNDYFCRDCMAAVCLAGDRVLIYHPESGKRVEMPWPRARLGA